MKRLLTTVAFGMLGITTVFAGPHEEPTSPAANINFSSIDGNKMNIKWQNGNGSRRLVIARKTNMVTSTPVNGFVYSADAVFGKGSEISKGAFVVYNGRGSEVTVSGLSANRSYYFAVYEYNGEGRSTEYISTALTGNIATLAAPSFPPVGVSVSDVTAHSMTLSWSDDLLKGSGRIVLIRADAAVNAKPADLATYTASNVLWSGSRIGDDNYVVYEGTGNSVTVENLEANTVYHFAIFEYNGTEGKVYNVSKPVRINASNSTKQAVKTNVSK